LVLVWQCIRVLAGKWLWQYLWGLTWKWLGHYPQELLLLQESVIALGASFEGEPCRRWAWVE
jgi:hypothetical protein